MRLRQMEKISISGRDQYDYAKSRGYEPLLSLDFHVEFDLRIEIQREMFPKYSRANNMKFYRWIWDNWPRERLCEETLQPLHEYSSCFISHIYSRGAHPEMAYDSRNVNLLSKQAHARWEDSFKRKSMRIYHRNSMTMDELIKDYQNIKKY